MSFFEKMKQKKVILFLIIILLYIFSCPFSGLSRLQKVETRTGTGERLMISNSSSHHNARYRCSPVPTPRKNLLFAGDSDYAFLVSVHMDTGLMVKLFPLT